MSPPASERAKPIAPHLPVTHRLRPSNGARTAQRAVPTTPLNTYPNAELRTPRDALAIGSWTFDVRCSMFLCCSVAAPPRCVTSVCEEYVPNRHAVAVPLLFAVKDGFIQHAEVFNPGQSLPRAKS